MGITQSYEPEHIESVHEGCNTCDDEECKTEKPFNPILVGTVNILLKIYFLFAFLFCYSFLGSKLFILYAIIPLLWALIIQCMLIAHRNASPVNNTLYGERRLAKKIRKRRRIFRSCFDLWNQSAFWKYLFTLFPLAITSPCHSLSFSPYLLFCCFFPDDRLSKARSDPEANCKWE